MTRPQPRQPGEKARRDHGYAPLSVPLLEALLAAQLSKRDWQVVMAIVRETYGWKQRASVDITISMLATVAKLTRPHTSATLKALADRRIITMEKGEIGFVIGLNPFVDNWAQTSQNGTSQNGTSQNGTSQNGTESVPKRDGLPSQNGTDPYIEIYRDREYGADAPETSQNGTGKTVDKKQPEGKGNGGQGDGDHTVWKTGKAILGDKLFGKKIREHGADRMRAAILHTLAGDRGDTKTYLLGCLNNPRLQIPSAKLVEDSREPPKQRMFGE